MFAARTTIGLPLVIASQGWVTSGLLKTAYGCSRPSIVCPKLDSSISVVVDWMSFRYCTISS